MLKPSANGHLQGSGGVELPISTHRLQATFSRQGLEKVAVWGNGEVGSLLFLNPVPESAAVTLSPNRYRAEWSGNRVEIVAIPDAPILLIDIEGPAVGGVRLKAPSVKYAGLDPTVRRTSESHRVKQQTEQGVLDAHSRQASASGRTLRLNGGGLITVTAGGAEEIAPFIEQPEVESRRKSADEYNDWLSSRFSVDDPLLASMFVHCLHAGVSSIKHDRFGNFSGLSAGYGYSLPARTYYRDGYWTTLALLPFRPEAVRTEVLALARGIHENGEAPSGVILSSPTGEKHWEALRTSTEEYRRNHPIPGDWWSDHFDSPLFFILMALEYVRWTGEVELLDDASAGKSVWRLIELILDRYEALGNPAPLKPYNDRDWADNVTRGGYVTYDLGLYYGALSMAVQLGTGRKSPKVPQWKRSMEATRQLLTEQLWMADRGHFAEFDRPEGNREEHLALETATALRFGAATPDQIEQTLSAYRTHLETRNNGQQPYGDWGVMCAYPPFAKTTETRSKSAFAYRYHNGSDWPYWDGVYAELLLARDDAGWRYPLTRWWEYGLSQGWPEPVEFFSPPWGVGSRLQGWSGTPAAAIVTGGFGVAPDRAPKLPPWGDSELHGVKLRGEELNLNVRDGRLEVE